MSWINQIKENIKIITGDGKSYSPLYVISDVKDEFNISKFDFPNVNGTLVKRTTVMGATFPLELRFQGDDHLEVAENFRSSSRDKRPWTIYHPIYGSIKAHPGSLTYDSRGLSTTIITGEFHETISDEYPRISASPSEEVGVLALKATETIEIDYTDNVIVDTSATNQMADMSENVYNLGASSIKSGDNAIDYENAFTDANSAIQTGITDASAMVQNVINLIEYPSKFTDSVINRLSLLSTQFNQLSLAVDTYTTPNEKKGYEFAVLGVMNAMVKTAISPQKGNYTNSVSVFNVINQILSVYNQLIANLDALQTANNGTTNSYSPNYTSMNSIFTVVNYTIANLYTIALTAKQERKVILEKDSNVIIQAHRFYGLETDDSTIDEFMDTNTIGLNEYFELKKGRVLIYFV